MNDELLATLAAANPVPAAELDLDAGLREALRRGRSGSRLAQPPARVTRGRLGVFAGLAALVVVASALALGSPTVDFFSAKKAPSWEFVNFGRLSRLQAYLTGRRLGNGMQLAAPAREITDVKFGGKDHVLVVAPLKGGGICSSWSGGYLGSSCGELDRGNPLEPHLVRAGIAQIIAVDGIVNSHAASELRVVFQDGTTATIPVVYVSKPIDAGFFLFPLPAANRHGGHYPYELQLLAADGKPIVTRAVYVTFPKPLAVHTVPGFGPMVVPRQAIFSRRRLLFHVSTAVPTTRGIRRGTLGLWIAPKTGGGTCIWTSGAGLFGCNQHRVSYGAALPVEPDFYGDTICCEVGPDVARVELRFQDGKRLELHPKAGYLLASIPLSHYVRGHRMTEEVAYNRAGAVIQVRTLSPNKVGEYPCAHPSVRKFGMMLCP